MLAFVARRLDDEPVGFLLAKRADHPSAFEQALERHRLERLDVGPLSFGATRRYATGGVVQTTPRGPGRICSARVG